MAKSSKRDAQYQGSPKDGKQCSGCSMFRPPGSCTAVEGSVSPQGYCKYYATAKLRKPTIAEGY